MTATATHILHKTKNGETMSDERQVALGNALAQIERQFGKGSIMKLGDFQERLLLVCGGKTIPEFLAEAEVLDADSVPRLLEALERRAAE